MNQIFDQRIINGSETNCSAYMWYKDEQRIVSVISSPQLSRGLEYSELMGDALINYGPITRAVAMVNILFSRRCPPYAL